MSDAAQLWNHAEECKRLAAHSGNDEDKAFWLELAGDWLRLALEAEQTAQAHDQRTPQRSRQQNGNLDDSLRAQDAKRHLLAGATHRDIDC